MGENNKKYFVAIAVLIFILFFLVIIQSLTKKNKEKETTTTTTIPTTVKGSAGFFRTGNKPSPTSSIKKTTQHVDIPKSIIPTEIIPLTNTGEDGYVPKKTPSKNLDELTQQLPVSFEEFSLTYDPTTKQYIATINEPTSDNLIKFRQWLKRNGYDNTNLRYKIIIQDNNQQQLSWQESDNQFKQTEKLDKAINVIDRLLNLTTNIDLSNINYNITISPSANQSNSNNTSYGNPPPGGSYSTGSNRCDNPARYIQLYADNTNSTSCYADVKRKVESNLTSVELLGHKISVHKKVAQYFQAVNNELSKYKVGGTSYKFQKGDYNFYYVGTYCFRCNVNASSSRDLCSSDCVLSTHAFGISVDINPETNCNGCSTFDMPQEVVTAFENNGFRWGGRYKELYGAKIDAMHFEYLAEACGS